MLSCVLLACLFFFVWVRITGNILTCKQTVEKRVSMFVESMVVDETSFAVINDEELSSTAYRWSKWQFQTMLFFYLELKKPFLLTFIFHRNVQLCVFSAANNKIFPRRTTTRKYNALHAYKIP
jgi:hypothetical protein